MLPLQTRLLLRRNNTCTDQCCPQIIQANLDSCIKTHQKSIQMVKKRQANLEWEGVTGSLTSATISLNLEPKLLSCSIQSVLSFWHHVCCNVGKTSLPPSKNKQKLTAVSEAIGY